MATARLTIDGLAAGGDGVARLGGRAVFVPGTAPGDVLEAELVEEHPRWARARLVRLLQPGPGRVAPPCPVYADCGGCQWQHLDYAVQLDWKRRLVVDALSRIGGLADVPVHPCLPCEPPWSYRHKVAVPFGRVGGRTVSGFFAPGSHRIVEFESCAIQHPLLDRVVAAVRRIAARRGIDGYDEASRRGTLRHLVARANHAGDQV